MLYTVGEMAKVLDMPASTLRYYDKEGLLPRVERSSGGMRMFSDKDYEWLKVVECLKRSGLSIKEIKSFAEMVDRGDTSLQERLSLFHTRRELVKQQMVQLQETLDFLEYKCWYYGQAVKEGTEARIRALMVDELPEQHQKTKRKMNL